jgi:hypothetical protein
MDANKIQKVSVTKKTKTGEGVDWGVTGKEFSGG